MINQVQERRAGFFVVDEAGVIVQANDRARDLIGAARELVGRPIADLIPRLAEEDDQRISTLLCDDGTDLPIFIDRKSTRLNSSHVSESRMPSSA